MSENVRKIDYETRCRIIHVLTLLNKSDVEIGKAVGVGVRQVPRYRQRPEYQALEEEARQEARKLSEQVFIVQEKIISEVNTFCDDLKKGVNKIPDFDKRVRALNALSKFCQLSLTYES